MHVRELVARIEAEPGQLLGRPSKVISDALRWEIARGRVRKLDRGLYEFVGAPRTTLRAIHLGAAELREVLARHAAEHD